MYYLLAFFVLTNGVIYDMMKAYCLCKEALLMQMINKRESTLKDNRYVHAEVEVFHGEMFEKVNDISSP